MDFQNFPLRLRPVMAGLFRKPIRPPLGRPAWSRRTGSPERPYMKGEGQRKGLQPYLTGFGCLLFFFLFQRNIIILKSILTLTEIIVTIMKKKKQRRYRLTQMPRKVRGESCGDLFGRPDRIFLKYLLVRY